MGIQPTATHEQIKYAYRKLSTKFHPDKNNGDVFLGEMCKNINEANEILSNPQNRKIYDDRLNLINNSYIKSNENSITSKEKEEIITNVNDLFEHIKMYFEKSDIATAKYLALMKTQNTAKPNYLNAAKILVSILLFISLWAFVKPSNNTLPESITNNNSYTWSANKHTDIYVKPDINSIVIGTVSAGTGFHALEETKHFILIEFLDTYGNKKQGYIRKKDLTHKIEKVQLNSLKRPPYENKLKQNQVLIDTSRTKIEVNIIENGRSFQILFLKDSDVNYFQGTLLRISPPKRGEYANATMAKDLNLS